MSIIQNVPCLSIMLTLFMAIITSAVKGRMARRLSIFITVLTGAMSLILLVYLVGTGESFVYTMGHFPAPWGNEVRAGMLEPALAILFCLIVLLSLWGGVEETRRDLEEDKSNFYYIMVDLMLAANLALIYTNDMFTAYVFVEIGTIAACGLILGKFRDTTIEAGVRYMVMSLLGSGLLLMGICFFYTVTGHLLMSNVKEGMMQIAQSGAYLVPMMLTIGLVSVGLAIKSGLWPFHTWMPNAYGHSTVSSAAMLSSIVSKGYIILLIKVIYRMVGLDIFVSTKIVNVLFVFGIIGMIVGSVEAIRQTNLRKMIAFSSVAQIGYIYMGIGLGTEAGMEASVYHIFAHSTAKALAFVAAAGLMKASGGKNTIAGLKGAGFRNKTAGVAFVAASLSMIGIPGFGGFVSKMLFATASVDSTIHAAMVLSALALSTVLNAVYFMKVVLVIYTPSGKEDIASGFRSGIAKNRLPYRASVAGFIVLNLFLGIGVSPMLHVIRYGLQIFG